MTRGSVQFSAPWITKSDNTAIYKIRSVEFRNNSPLIADDTSSATSASTGNLTGESHTPASTATSTKSARQKFWRLSTDPPNLRLCHVIGRFPSTLFVNYSGKGSINVVTQIYLNIGWRFFPKSSCVQKIRLRLYYSIFTFKYQRPIKIL